MCEICNEMVYIANTIGNHPSRQYSGSIVEDIINHILNGHSSARVIDKFNIG